MIAITHVYMRCHCCCTVINMLSENWSEISTILDVDMKPATINGNESESDGTKRLKTAVIGLLSCHFNHTEITYLMLTWVL